MRDNYLVVENKRRSGWYVLDLRTRNWSREFRTQREATIEMYSLRIRNMMHS